MGESAASRLASWLTAWVGGWWGGQPAGPRRSLCAASVALHGFIVEALEREGDDNSLQDAAQVRPSASQPASQHSLAASTEETHRQAESEERRLWMDGWMGGCLV